MVNSGVLLLFRFFLAIFLLLFLFLVLLLLVLLLLVLLLLVLLLLVLFLILVLFLLVLLLLLLRLGNLLLVGVGQLLEDNIGFVRLGVKGHSSCNFALENKFLLELTFIVIHHQLMLADLETTYQVIFIENLH